MKKCVFLDRDGTINEEAPYIADVQDLHIYPYAASAIKRLNEAGFLVIVVTNQSGVGRGLIHPESLEEIHRVLKKRLAVDGARIDAIYTCPHRPEDLCDCRKPAPGLLIRAIRDHRINPKKSFLIGDKYEDVMAARAVDITPILVRTGHGRETELLSEVHPVRIADNLADAVEIILREAEGS